MKAFIINIGDELLIGQVVNTNAATMSRLLTSAGIEVAGTLVVGDSADAIRQAIDLATSAADAVLITGGLGPTKDDITKHLLCDYFGSTLVESPEALANVARIFESRGYPLTPINRAQAMVPACCEVLNNDVGTAPCMWFATGRERQVLVSLPGVPFEMEWLMTHRVLPRLCAHFQVGLVLTKNILTQGIGESFLSDLLEPWETALPAALRLAYLPEAGMVKLRLTAISAESDEPSRHRLNALLAQALDGLRQLAQPYIVGEDSENLPEALHRRLLDLGLTLATAESCTGGTIASRMTAQAGASAYFRGGVVAYSNDVKRVALGVDVAVLAEHGAVSEPTARAMAEGVRQRFASDLAIATTGIAGPGGAVPGKPVGTVYVAIATPTHTDVQRLDLGSGPRQQIINRAINHLLAMLLRLLDAQGGTLEAQPSHPSLP